MTEGDIGITGLRMGGVAEWATDNWKGAEMDDEKERPEVTVTNGGYEVKEVNQKPPPDPPPPPPRPGVMTEHPTLERFITKLASRTEPLGLKAKVVPCIGPGTGLVIQPQDLLALIREVMATSVEGLPKPIIETAHDRPEVGDIVDGPCGPGVVISSDEDGFTANSLDGREWG